MNCGGGLATRRPAEMANARLKSRGADDQRVAADEKIARLLGLLLTKDIKNKTDAVPMLRRAGFSVTDVANLLNMAENHVRVADHQGRKKKQKS
jgi:hypothetical protein